MAKHPNIRAPYDPGKAARERFQTSEPVRPAPTAEQRRGVRIGLRPDPRLEEVASLEVAETAAAQDKPQSRPRSSPKPASLKRDDPGRK
jgi:hypothetical protein